MKFIRTLALLIFLILPLRADAADCAPHKDVVKALMKKGYMWLATTITDQGFVMQVYVGRKGDAYMIMIDGDMNACAVAHFTQWMAPLERAI